MTSSPEHADVRGSPLGKAGGGPGDSLRLSEGCVPEARLPAFLPGLQGAGRLEELCFLGVRLGGSEGKAVCSPSSVLSVTPVPMRWGRAWERAPCPCTTAGS